MKHFTFVLLAMLGGCSSGYDTIIECYSTSQFRKFSTPSFSSYIMNVKSGDQSRIDMYIQMPYKNIRFEKSADGFKASYSLTFVIKDNAKEIIQTKEIDRTIQARTYEETVSSRFDFYFQSFLLAPNEYNIEVVAKDQISSLRYTHREKFTAQNYSDSAHVASTILFLNTMLRDEKGITIRPILPTSLSLLSDSIGMFQELYNIRMNDTIQISETYRMHRTQEKSEQSFAYLMPPYRVTAQSCGNNFDSVYFRKDSVFRAARNGTLQVFQFHPLPSYGGSAIDRAIYVKRNGTIDSVVFSKNVFRRNKRYLSSLSIDEEISAMRYIMREQEYDSLVSPTNNDKNVTVNAFWEHRGGDAHRKEFEQKIVEANALFTSCVDGSLTPMGIVYIVCGTPDYIDCRGTYIESWLYNVGDRVFPIEFRRVGEQSSIFELIPFSINESIWQYFIDQWRKKK